MAITNHERVGKTLELLKAGLAPFKKSPASFATASTPFASARSGLPKRSRTMAWCRAGRRLFGSRENPQRAPPSRRRRL
jgi:hypothetical protein